MRDERRFKVGDKVRSISPEAYQESIPLGSVHTVSGVHGEYISVDQRAVHYNPWRFELVEDEQKFKVGDRVRVVDPAVEQWDMRLGDVVTVERVSTTGNTIRVSGSRWAWSPWRFELVEQAKPEPSPLARYGANDIIALREAGIISRGEARRALGLSS